MRRGEFTWYFLDQKDRPYRVVEVINPRTMIIRPWRFTDWPAYLLRNVKTAAVDKWWDLVERVEEFLDNIRKPK